MKDHSPDRITFKNALLYNQYIVERHKELMEDINTYNLAIQHDYVFGSERLDSILKHATQSLQDIQNMAPYRGDSSFREVSADIFKYYSGQFIQEGKMLISLKSKVDSGNADYDEVEAFNKLVKKIDLHSQPIQTRLEEIQLRFARKNNLTLSIENSNEQEH